jgi:hypothetical protein
MNNYSILLKFFKLLVTHILFMNNLNNLNNPLTHWLRDSGHSEPEMSIFQCIEMMLEGLLCTSSKQISTTSNSNNFPQKNDSLNCPTKIVNDHLRNKCS